MDISKFKFTPSKTRPWGLIGHLEHDYYGTIQIFQEVFYWTVKGVGELPFNKSVLGLIKSIQENQKGKA